MRDEDFDFQAYIAAQKEPAGRARLLRFGTYAFRGDIKDLRLLHALPPVRMVVGAGRQLWLGWGRSAVLKDARRVGDKGTERLARLSQHCLQALQMPSLPIYVTHHLRSLGAQALGDAEEAFVAVHHEAATVRSDEALRFMLGRELGHVQNGHVPHCTALFYADEIAGTAVRWALRPGLLALRRWRRHAALTADRAGLLCCHSVEVATQEICRALVAAQRQKQDVDLAEVMAQVMAVVGGEKASGDETEALADAALRVAALQRFAQSQYYYDHLKVRDDKGQTLAEIDDQLEGMLRGYWGPKEARG